MGVLTGGSNGDRTTLVLDVGKTNVKLLVMSKAGEILDIARLDNCSLDGPPYLHLDTERIWQWMLETIGELARAHRIDAIVPTTHGGAMALIRGGELVLPILDYEFELPAEVMCEYARVRPPFDQTQTPDMPLGLSMGRQLFWLQNAFADRFNAAEMVLMYPQYWSWRLSGVAASELTMIGCHGDLWRPNRKTFSTLVDSQGWRRLFPPIRAAYDALGPVLPEIVERTGLPADCRVLTGIHDTNGAYSLYLRGYDRPFSLISTGTWVMMISPRFSLSRLDESRDTLALTNLLGEPLPTARYMGGRDYEILSRRIDDDATLSEGDLRAVIDKRSFLLPSYTPGGPFAGRTSGTAGADPASPGEQTARLILYLVLMTWTGTSMLEMDGDLIIDGGFVNNPWYCRLLTALTGRDRCFVNHQTEGTAVGAGMLAVWHDHDIPWPLSLSAVEKCELPGLTEYAHHWRRLVEQHG